MAFRYNYAIVCRVPHSFKNSRRLKNNNDISMEKAKAQLDLYVESLRTLGISILELPPDDKYPDGVFVDDCAVVINGTALICNMGEKSRAGEVSIIRKTLKKELGLRIVEVDKDNATVDGGDVLWTGKEIFVGLSNRTNELGAQTVAKAFPEYPTSTIRLPQGQYHLKNIIGVAGPEILTCSADSTAGKDLLKQIGNVATFDYHLMEVDPAEGHAAGCLFINGHILHQTYEEIPNTYPMFEKKFDKRVETSISEFQKAHGSLASLALLVAKVKNPKHIPFTI